MMFFAARNFFDEEPRVVLAAPLAALLGTAYWWNSYPREMFFYGMVGFPVSSFFSVLTLSLFYRILKSDRYLTCAHVAWVLAAVLILPLHFQTILILTPAGFSLLIVRWRSLHYPKVLLWLEVAVGVSLLANLVWLLPFLGHVGDDASASIVAQLRLFVSTDPLTFLKDYLRPAGYWTFRSSFLEKGLRWVLVMLGSLGIYRLIRSERREIGIALACAVLTLFVVTYFGSLLSVFQKWQPLRFKVPYDIFLALASSYFIATLALRRLTNSRLILLSLLLVFGSGSFIANLFGTESENKMILRTRPLPEVEEIVDWIRKEAPQQGRVLFEESGDETGFVYDGMYLSSFIPHRTGLQLIGGPINLYNDRHHFAEFHSGVLFKRDIGEFTDEELRLYFRTYNIGAIVAFHPRSVQRLLSVPQLVSLERSLGDVHLMKVNQPLNWFLKGEGSVGVGWNRIRLSNVKGSEVILKYHWVEGLNGSPPVKIEPVKILDDPIPFIKIIDPPQDSLLP